MQKSIPKINVVVHILYSVIQFLGMWARVDPKRWDGDTPPSQNKPNWSNPQQLRKVQSFVERCWKGGSQLCKGKSAQKIIIHIYVCLVCIAFMCSVSPSQELCIWVALIIEFLIMWFYELLINYIAGVWEFA